MQQLIISFVCLCLEQQIYKNKVLVTKLWVTPNSHKNPRTLRAAKAAKDGSLPRF